MTHHYTDKNPMTEARRNAIHGPLEPMDSRKESIAWIVLAGFAFGVFGFLACVADLPGVGA